MIKTIERFFLWLRFKTIMHQLNTDLPLQLSSFIQTTMGHPQFIKLVTLGKSILPFLLKDLQKTKRDMPAPGTHTILCALAVISGENIIPNEHRGKTIKMQEDWLDWGRIKKLL